MYDRKVFHHKIYYKKIVVPFPIKGERQEQTARKRQGTDKLFQLTI